MVAGVDVVVVDQGVVLITEVGVAVLNDSSISFEGTNKLEFLDSEGKLFSVEVDGLASFLILIRFLDS